MHIHIILYTLRAACLVLFAVCQRSSFAVSRSEHKNASGDLTPVASRKRVQRYGVFIYRPNLSATFLKVFWKKKGKGRERGYFEPLQAHRAHVISILQRIIFRSYSACYFALGAHHSANTIPISFFHSFIFGFAEDAHAQHSYNQFDLYARSIASFILTKCLHSFIFSFFHS